MGRKLTDFEFKSKYGDKFNPTIELIETYNGMHTKIQYRCKICNNKHSAKAADLAHGVGCPNCARTQSSFAEMFIYEALNKVGLYLVHRDRKTIGMELDILLPNEKYAIEPGSWTFHQKFLENDLKKEKKCREAGIKLLIIYDNYKTNSDLKVDQSKFIKAFPFWLATEKGYETLKDIVKCILNEINVDYSFSSADWESIKETALFRSRRIKDEEFKEILAKKNPNIILVEELGINLSTKAKFQCKICQHKWRVAPVSLIRSDRPTGCPKCGGTHLKTHEEFVEQIKKINPDIEITGRYHRSSERIQYRCKCGEIAEVQASRLLSAGFTCPKCSRQKLSKEMTKSQTDFIIQVANKNQDIEVIGEYTSDRATIPCKCKICNHEWSPHAGDILQGHGCPLCAKRKIAKSRQKPVKCIETNITYDSLREASEKTKISTETIRKSCKTGKKTAYGFTWVYVKR